VKEVRPVRRYRELEPAPLGIAREVFGVGAGGLGIEDGAAREARGRLDLDDERPLGLRVDRLNEIGALGLRAARTEGVGRAVEVGREQDLAALRELQNPQLRERRCLARVARGCRRGWARGARVGRASVALLGLERGFAAVGARADALLRPARLRALNEVPAGAGRSFDARHGPHRRRELTLPGVRPRASDEKRNR
jgi:hypothetical protein